MATLGQRLAGGEQAAYAELYDACADRLHHYLVAVLRCREDADDVLQETFVRLARSRRRLAGVEALIPYVFTVARHEAARLVGRRARQHQQQADLWAEWLFREARGSDVQQRETAEMVASALDRLSDPQREIVELKTYAGLTFREIAEVTGLPQGTVATRYRAALHKLREWFAGKLS
jgi:RNA polymerase sigma-70 factor (ECF subfamily)